MLKPHQFIPLIIITSATFFISCGSSETESMPEKAGIDTLHYEDSTMLAVDTISTIDSLMPTSANIPMLPDDSAALALKARLAADTLSARISDSVKREIRKAREYMRQKQNR